MPATYRFATPRVRGEHAHGTSPQNIGCAACRREAWADFEATRLAHKARAETRHAHKATRAQTVAGATFGILGVSFPVWALAFLTGAGPQVILLWTALMVGTFLVSEGPARPVEDEPKPSLFAVEAYVLDHPTPNERRVIHLVEADNERRARLARARAEPRAAPMRARALATRELAAKGRRPGDEDRDDLPF
jgi:hypothetical protein